MWHRAAGKLWDHYSDFGWMQVAQGKPAKLEHEPEEEEVSLLAGHMQEDVSTTNQKPMLLGLLKVWFIHDLDVGMR